jgi:hypothetical protein
MFKYISTGEVIPTGAPFTDHNGIKHPANWLERALPRELETAGIKKYDDPAPIDFRFASGYDASGNIIWRAFAEVQPAFKQQTQNQANMLLHPTDWMVIRQVDNGVEMDASIKTWRESIRTACGQKLNKIDTYTTTPALANYAATDEYNDWPSLNS